MEPKTVLEYLWEFRDVLIPVGGGYAIVTIKNKVRERVDARGDYLKIMGLEGNYDPFADMPLDQIIENITMYKNI